MSLCKHVYATHICRLIQKQLYNILPMKKLFCGGMHLNKLVATRQSNQRERARENLYLEFGHFGSTDPFHAPKWRQFQCSDVNSFSFLLRKEDQGNCANHTEEMGTESRGTN